MGQNVLFTIITVSYNSESTIRETIESIIHQNYSNFEYIIIDGASSDKTISIIKDYEPLLLEKGISFKWKSEPDKGIGDAWNKGLQLATGEMIGLLNSDDAYHPSTIATIANQIKKDSSPKVYYGICKFIQGNEIVGVNNSLFDENKLTRGFGFTHTTCFVHKEIYEKVGNFNTDVKIAVDTEFLIRCFQQGVEFQQLNNITYMSLGGVSDQYAKKGYFEYLDILKDKEIVSLYKLKKQKYIYNIFVPFRKIIKSLVLKSFLRQVKHYLIYLFNFFYFLIPTFSLKKNYLKIFGAKLGEKSYIHSKVIFYTWGNLEIGSNSVINSGCRIDNRKKISIGSNVSISHNTQIYTCGHDINSQYFDITCKGVKIDDYACIFSNCLIMPGVHIGKGAVVYSGAVVTKDVEPFTVIGGNPAKKISERNKNLQYKINYGFHKAL
nr:glycosyltransferase [Aquimarina longa]